MKYLIAALVFLSTYQLASAGVIAKITRGSCTMPPTVPDFDPSKYLGFWYQYSGIPSFFSPSQTKCIRATYGAKDDGTVSVRNVAVSPSNEYTQICGYADIPDPSQPGSLEVHFPFAPTGVYKVLDTDYENFSSVYSCQDIVFGIKLEFAWLLVRDTANVSQDIIDRAFNAYTSNGISLDSFEKVDHEGCTYEDASNPPCN